MSDTVLEREARAKMSEAMQEYFDACTDKPGILTGFIVVYEITPADGIPEPYWMTGTGAIPTEGDTHGLPRHRGIGLLQYALSQWLPGRSQ